MTNATKVWARDHKLRLDYEQFATWCELTVVIYSQAIANDLLLGCKFTTCVSILWLGHEIAAITIVILQIDHELFARVGAISKFSTNFSKVHNSRLEFMFFNYNFYKKG